MAAYRELVDEDYHQIENVNISALQERSGIDMETLKEYLLLASREGWAVLGTGDWSLSSDAVRAGAVQLRGEPHLMVRFIPDKAAAAFQEEGREAAQPDEKEEAPRSGRAVDEAGHERIMTAYRELVEETGYKNVVISALQERSDIEMEALKEYLRSASADGRAVLGFGDISLASDDVKRGAIDIEGKAHLMVRFIPDKAAADFQEESRETARPDEPDETRRIREKILRDVGDPFAVDTAKLFGGMTDEENAFGSDETAKFSVRRNRVVDAIRPLSATGFGDRRWTRKDAERTAKAAGLSTARLPDSVPAAGVVVTPTAAGAANAAGWPASSNKPTVLTKTGDPLTVMTAAGLRRTGDGTDALTAGLLSEEPNFSLRTPPRVPAPETPRDLLVMHATTPGKLRKTDRLGAFPMPSAAVTKRGIAAAGSGFGNILFIGRKEMIDPAMPDHPVYGGDVYTPRTPDREFETAEDAVAAMGEAADVGGESGIGAQAQGPTDHALSRSMPRYRNLDEVRADRDRLTAFGNEEAERNFIDARRDFDAAMQAAGDAFFETIPEFVSDAERAEALHAFFEAAYEFSRSFERERDAAVEAGESPADRLREAAVMALELQGLDAMEEIAPEAVDGIVAMGEARSRMRVPFFEAKPKRPVAFSEWAAAVVDTSGMSRTDIESTRKILAERGVPVTIVNGREEMGKGLNRALAMEDVLFSVRRKSAADDRQLSLFGEEQGAARTEAPARRSRRRTPARTDPALVPAQAELWDTLLNGAPPKESEAEAETAAIADDMRDEVDDYDDDLEGPDDGPRISRKTAAEIESESAAYHNKLVDGLAAALRRDPARVVEDAVQWEEERFSVKRRVPTVLAEKIAGPTKKKHFVAAEAAAIRKGFVTYAFDRIHPIKMQVGESAYRFARLESGVPAVIQAFMEHGKIKLDDSGVPTTDTRREGFQTWVRQRGADFEKFLYWAVCRRAEKLAEEKRERWIDAETIRKYDEWVGDPETAESWHELETEFKEWNKNVLDFAVENGLIDKEAAALWAEDIYIPFYRVMEEDAQTGENILRAPKESRKHIISGIRKLQGGKLQLGDPLQNLMKNWTHLISQSVKNTARHKAVSEAMRLQRKTEMGDPVFTKLKQNQLKKITAFTDKKSGQATLVIRDAPDEMLVSYSRNGERVYYRVNDPAVYTAMVQSAGPYFGNFIMRLLAIPKNVIRGAVTFMPGFRARNVTRDTLHTGVVSGKTLPFVGSMIGAFKVLTEHPDYVDLVASGSAFGSTYATGEGGTRVESMSRHLRQIAKREGQGALARVLDTPRKLLAVWEKIGEAAEMGARVQLASRLKEEGVSLRDRAFEARDLLDFSLRGESGAVAFLIQTIPFLGARLQGLYKLGRAARENPGGFILRGGILTAASLALWGFNRDREEYRELQAWDRWAYYHFWIGGEHFRLPKPFEIGAIFSTAAEVAADTGTGREDFDHAMKWMAHFAGETLAFNPIPQAMKPAVEIATNRDFFSGLPIESRGMESLLPGDRWRTGTPWILREIGGVTGDVGLSPVRLEHLLRGYFGSLGHGIAVAADLPAQWAGWMPVKPQADLADAPLIKTFYRGGKDRPARRTQSMEEFYQLRREVDQLVGTIRTRNLLGDAEAARELYQNSRDRLALKGMVGKIGDRMAKINRQIRRIHENRDMSAEKKRREIDRLLEVRNELTRRVVERAKGRR